MDKPCRFCPVTREQILLEHPLAVAKPDRHPVSNGHTLIIPRRHVASFFETSEEERLAMLKLLDDAKDMLDREYRPDGYNIGINNGAAAGQSVMHAHIHLIPRYTGDRADPRGGVRWIFPEKAAYWEKK
ncbi:MAG: HIT family protein [Burkholderiales bacterium]